MEKLPGNDNKTNLIAQIKNIMIVLLLMAMVFVWGMSIQNTMTNIELNKLAIEKLDDIKADKTYTQAQIDALIVRMETLRETMNVYLKHIDEKLVDIQTKVDKLVIKE